MESDDIYDSLEEDLVSKCNDLDLTRTVPLYGGEKPLEAVKPKKLHFSSKIPVKCDARKAQGAAPGARKKPRHAGNKTTIDLLEYRQRNSYVDIFHAKNAKCRRDKGPSDTARPQVGDFTERSNISEVSNATHFSDAKSSCSDTTRS